MVPDDIGGRYSVLTAVGLLPIAVAGVDIDELMGGAADMMKVCEEKAGYDCPSWQYAAIRYELYRSGRSIELLGCYDPAFRFMAEWWKQLFGESEGKDDKGLYPASVEFTADLHSWASPATRTGRPSWRPNWRNKDKSGASGAAFSAAGGQKVNVKYQQTLNLLFCIVFYSVLCYA